MFLLPIILGGVTGFARKHFELREREVILKEIAFLLELIDYNTLTKEQKLELIKLLSDIENPQP